MANKQSVEFSPINEDSNTSSRYHKKAPGVPVPSRVLANRTLAIRAGLSPMRESSPVISSESSQIDSSSQSNDRDEIVTESQQVAIRKSDKNSLREELRKSIADVTEGLLKDNETAKDIDTPIPIKGKLSTKYQMSQYPFQNTHGTFLVPNLIKYQSPIYKILRMKPKTSKRSIMIYQIRKL